MRWLLMLALLALSGCWTEQAFAEACVAAGHCVVDGGIAAADGGVLDDGGVPTWDEVKAELFPDTLDAGFGFAVDFVDIGPLSGAWMGGVLTRSGSVVCIPLVGDLALEVSPNRTISTRSVPSHSGGWEGGVLLPDGTVLGLPNSATVFLVIPPDGGMPSLRDAGIPGSGLASPWFEGGVVTRSGSVLLAPSRGATPGVYDPAAGVLSLLDAGAQVTAGPQFSGAVLLKDGESALLVPTENEQVLWVSPGSGAPQAALSKLAGGVLLPSGEVLMTPRYDARFARVSGASLTFVGPATTSAYFSAAWSTNGYAYAVQTDSVVGHIAVIDRSGNVAEQAFSDPNLTVGSHYGFVSMADGTIVGCPFQSRKVMLLSPDDRRTVSLRTMTSPWLDKW